MKRAHNFRLNSGVTYVLQELSEKKGRTKTDIVEDAILEYAGHKSKEKKEFLRFAGSIPGEIMNEVLDNIKKNRVDKEIKVYF